MFDCFLKFKARVEKESGRRIKILRSDNGGEYKSLAFSKYLEKEGIQHQLTAPYSPQQNGVSERKNQTIMEMTGCLLMEKGLYKNFWAEAANTAVYLLNLLPTKALKDVTPHEAWFKNRPSVSHLHIFGCLCYVHVPAELKINCSLKHKKEYLSATAWSQKPTEFILSILVRFS